MQETYLKLNKEHIYIRHNGIIPGRKSILIVHGLGDSGLNHKFIFQYRQFDDWNIVIPDLIGYGRSSRSSKADGYSYKAHLKRLWHLIKKYQLNNIILIGHSMGGDLTTLLCQADTKGIIKKYVNIEGDVTQFDLFISGRAVEADKLNRFDEWFREDLMQEMIFKQSGQFRSCQLYYASLNFCRRDAFLENAKEIVQRNTCLPGEYKSEIGQIYCSLNVPQIFCYGTLSLSDRTLAFLNENDMATMKFEGAGHSPMVDKSEDFYKFLIQYIS